MSKIGLFYGTQTGKTESIAEMIRDEFGAGEIDMYDMSQVDVSDFDGYNQLIIASPTWDIGELQSDWDAFFPEFDSMDFKGKTVAYFGTGDQLGYSDNFMVFLKQRFLHGAEKRSVIGQLKVTNTPNRKQRKMINLSV